MSKQAIARLNIYRNFGQILLWAKKSPFSPNLVDKTNKNSCLASAAKLEKEWGNKMIGQENNSYWSSILGEQLTKIILENSGRSVKKPKKIKNLLPDLETEDAIWEVKTSNWTVGGTAGEKILAVPYKYAEVPILYKKPLKIVCVAYQEWELVYKYKIFSENNSPERYKMIDFWKDMSIEYVSFNDLVKSIIVTD